MSRRRTQALFILVVVAGCGDPPSGSSVAVEASDSAGVRILSIGAPLASAPALEVTAVWRHGLAVGDYPFERIIAAALMSDGSAVVVDAGSDEVVAVSPEGGFQVWMPTGRGPAEVRRPIAVRVRDSSSVWVDDDGNGRLVVVSSAGVQRSVSTSGRYDLSLALRLRGVDGAGKLLMSTSAFPGGEIPGRWRMADLVTLDPTDLTVDSIAQYPIAEAAAGPGVDPFQPYGTSTVVGHSWAVGWSGTPEVRLLAPDGQVRTIVRWQAEARYPSQELVDRYEAYLRTALRRTNAGLAESRLETTIARQLADLDIDLRRPLPQFREIIGDDRGRVWVEAYEVGTVPARRFSVFDVGDGSIRSVVFPSPVTLLDVRGDRILAAVHSALDVQAVGLFRIGSVPDA